MIHLTLVEYIKPQSTQSACTTREKETDRDIFFSKKKYFPPKKIEKEIKKCPVIRAQGWGALLPC
jgi:hypothetical protein